MYDVPILLIIFNRPNHLQKVFHEIKKIQPKQLFIAADGPRDDVPSDFENCQACRNFIETAIDWDCDVKKNYAEKISAAVNAPRLEFLGCLRKWIVSSF